MHFLLFTLSGMEKRPGLLRVTGQHTGMTDLHLTRWGEHNARALARRLNGLAFVKVFTSPLQRARNTAECCKLSTDHVKRP
jgi:bisphosphoglycerate-dependent phosphoglycerate mutase